MLLLPLLLRWSVDYAVWSTGRDYTANDLQSLKKSQHWSFIVLSIRTRHFQARGLLVRSRLPFFRPPSPSPPSSRGPADSGSAVKTGEERDRRDDECGVVWPGWSHQRLNVDLAAKCRRYRYQLRLRRQFGTNRQTLAITGAGTWKQGRQPPIMETSGSVMPTLKIPTVVWKLSGNSLSIYYICLYVFMWLCTCVCMCVCLCVFVLVK